MTMKCSQTNEAWNAIYSANQSSRYANEGDIGIYYRLPKFIEMFKKNIPQINGFKILEIGGGLGETCDNLRSAFDGEAFEYTVTEYSPNAVNVLREKYGKCDNVAVQEADAENLPFANKSFDVVCAFDVMHHVSKPQKMAREMIRVSKRYIFMCEPCGLSLVRKTTELTKRSKELGERSYTPNEICKLFQMARGGGDNHSVLFLCSAQDQESTYETLHNAQ
jgi:ubiquinone/menaquinone biosynthesis C-methylase UbiE